MTSVRGKSSILVIEAVVFVPAISAINVTTTIVTVVVIDIIGAKHIMKHHYLKAGHSTQHVPRSGSFA